MLLDFDHYVPLEYVLVSNTFPKNWGCDVSFTILIFSLMHSGVIQVVNKNKGDFFPGCTFLCKIIK